MIAALEFELHVTFNVKPHFHELTNFSLIFHSFFLYHTLRVPHLSMSHISLSYIIMYKYSMDGKKVNPNDFLLIM